MNANSRDELPSVVLSALVALSVVHQIGDVFAKPAVPEMILVENPIELRHLGLKPVERLRHPFPVFLRVAAQHPVDFGLLDANLVQIVVRRFLRRHEIDKSLVYRIAPFLEFLIVHI